MPDGVPSTGFPACQNTKRLKRIIFTWEQLYELKRQYMREQYPSFAERQALAHKLKLQEYHVRVWFKNHRAKVSRTLRSRTERELGGRPVSPRPVPDFSVGPDFCSPGIPVWARAWALSSYLEFCVLRPQSVPPTCPCPGNPLSCSPWRTLSEDPCVSTHGQDWGCHTASSSQTHNQAWGGSHAGHPGSPPGHPRAPVPGLPLNSTPGLGGTLPLSPPSGFKAGLGEDPAQGSPGEVPETPEASSPWTWDSHSDKVAIPDFENVFISDPDDFPLS